MAVVGRVASAPYASEKTTRVPSGRGSGSEGGFVQLARKSITVFASEELPFAKKASASEALAARGSTSTWATVANLVTAMIGAGVLVLPATFARGGWVFSTAALLSVAALTVETGYVIDDCVVAIEERARHGAAFSFGARPQRLDDLCEASFGSCGRPASFALVNTLLLLICAAYLLFIGQGLEFLL